MIVNEIKKYLTKNKYLIASICISLAIHILALFLDVTITQQPPKPERTEVRVEIKPSKETFFVEEVYETRGTYKCPNSYVGVGFKYRWLSNEITDISPGSPAEKIGLQPGDIILSMTNSNDRKVGDDFSITILRSNNTITYKLTMEDICTK